MSILDKVMDSITVTGVPQKVNYTTSIFKINNQIRMNNKELEKLTTQVGEQYLSQHLNDEKPEFPNLIDTIKRIQQENNSLLKEIEQLKESQLEEEALRQQSIQERQNQREIIRQQKAEYKENITRKMNEAIKYCEKCNEKNEIDAKFCVHCGNIFPTKTEVTEPK